MRQPSKVRVEDKAQKFILFGELNISMVKRGFNEGETLPREEHSSGLGGRKGQAPLSGPGFNYIKGLLDQKNALIREPVANPNCNVVGV